MIKSDHLDSPAVWAQPPADPDAAVVQAARRDATAFGLLYERYVQVVYRYCLHRLQNRESAEDATAQIFMKALAGLGGYRHDAMSFRSWLFAIAHNLLVDIERVHRPHHLLTDALTLTDPAQGPEDAALAAESGRTVRALLAAVPAEQRRILELRLAGLSTAEIARALGTSVGAVRVGQCRAIKRLRVAMGLAPHGEGSDA